MSWIKRLSVLIIVLIATILLLILSEYILRTKMGLGEPIVYEPHPLWGYAPKPNASYMRFGGDVVSFNNVGARSTSDWRVDERNILFLGDSITYGGSYIADKQTFASLACNQLDNWICHNAGVNAYGILNMVARSRYDERINSAPMRVFTFVTGDFDRGLQKADNAHFILRQPPTFFPALWEVGNFVASRITPKKWFGKNTQNKLSDAQKEHQRFVNRSFALDVFVTEIERLRLLNKKFLLVHSPSRKELAEPRVIDENKILTKLQEMYPDDIVMLEPILREAFQNNRANLYRDNVHYAEEGHRIVGNALSRILSQKCTKNQLNLPGSQKGVRQLQHQDHCGLVDGLR